MKRWNPKLGQIITIEEYARRRPEISVGYGIDWDKEIAEWEARCIRTLNEGFTQVRTEAELQQTKDWEAQFAKGLKETSRIWVEHDA